MEFIIDLLAHGRWRVLNEPRGFIRIIQWFMAIIAFALCADYEGSFIFTFTSKGEPTHQTILIQYPYDLALSNRDFYLLDGDGNKKPTELHGDVSPSAEWFVFVGVLSFLYCMMSLGYYVFLETDMTVSGSPPMLNSVDLGISVVNTFFWLCAASSLAWAKGQLLGLTGQNFQQEADIKEFCAIESCQSTEPSFVKLNSSIAFGFLNIFLWGAGSWFTWKETSLFTRIDQPAQPTTA